MKGLEGYNIQIGFIKPFSYPSLYSHLLSLHPNTLFDN